MVLCLSRSSTYPFTEPSLYTQATPSGPYYEDPPTTRSQVSTPVTSQQVPVTTGFSGGGTGITVVSGASSSGGGGGGTGAGVVPGGGAGSVASGGVSGGFVVPSSYVMGSGGQNYTHNIRASPATVSTHQRFSFKARVRFQHELSALINMLMEGPHKHTKKNVCVCVGAMAVG